MTLLQALRDFAREALVGLLRSLRVSALAILTIGVSLFLAAAFYLASRNLEETVEQWRDEARFVVYLDPSTDSATLESVRTAIAGSRWVSSLEVVSREEAEQRFTRTFPSLSEIVHAGANASLPPSIEVALAPIDAGAETSFTAWRREIEALPSVELVDDDRDWIEQIGTVLNLVRALGLVLTVVLVGASIFTIASVVRLTSYLYRDEIAVMRLVGATEFYIRGPFYLEGMFQGLLGSLAALAGLVGAYFGIAPDVGRSLMASSLLHRFLTPGEIAGLLGFGALAGLVGAIVSLGREPVGGEAST
jgi:cell division transport system permease protein